MHINIMFREKKKDKRLIGIYLKSMMEDERAGDAARCTSTFLFLHDERHTAYHQHYYYYY